MPHFWAPMTTRLGSAGRLGRLSRMGGRGYSSRMPGASSAVATTHALDVYGLRIAIGGDWPEVAEQVFRDFAWFVELEGAGDGARTGGVTVFPNPYKVQSAWDANTLVRDHYLWFANLPQRCHLAIFTLAGDLVFDTDFDGSAYHGANARGLYDPQQEIDIPPPTLSGASYAWNLISREGQAVATGMYLYAVKDLANGRVQRGKFLVLKSDREGF